MAWQAVGVGTSPSPFPCIHPLPALAQHLKKTEKARCLAWKYTSSDQIESFSAGGPGGAARVLAGEVLVLVPA